MRHEVCVHEYEVTPNKFKQGRRCPKCAKKKRANSHRKDEEQFKKEIYALVGDEYTLLSTYVSTHKKVQMLHNSCGHEYSVSPAKFLTGRRCPRCGRISTHEKKTKTFEQVKQEIYDMVGDEFRIVGNYYGLKKKTAFYHKLCGREYQLTPRSFYNGSRCTLCAMDAFVEKLSKSHDEFKKEIWSLVQEEYSLLSTYVGSHEKVTLRHNLCGKTFKMSPTKFLTGQRCPKCRESKGERRVEECLYKLRADFEAQIRFEDCRNELPLPFDFGIYNDNTIVGLIEYDGILHFEEKGFEKSFRRIQLTDKIKNGYCEEKNIPLLRIPYWEFENVEKLIIDFLRDKIEIIVDEEAFINEIKRRIEADEEQVMREQASKRKEKTKLYQQTEQYKKIVRVTGVLQRALNKGEISRPNSCEHCYKECKPEAAREDYDRPLEIVWLCRSCRRKFNQKKNENTIHGHKKPNR
jgi:hypothetical protein